MNISSQGLNELKKSEAFREFAYPDPMSKLARTYRSKFWGFKPAAEIMESAPAGLTFDDGAPWTVGYGETSASGSKVDHTSRRTEAEALSYLKFKVKRYENVVERYITVGLTQGQFDALVQLAWNVESALGKNSTVVKCCNKRDWIGASKAFELYDNARIDGKLQKSEALARRRKKEGAAFLAASPAQYQSAEAFNTQAEARTLNEQLNPEAAYADIPERHDVAPERPLRDSQINKAATVGTVAVGVSAATDAVDAVKDLNNSLASVASWLPGVLLLVGVICFAYIMYQRKKQRDGGWA